MVVFRTESAPQLRQVAAGASPRPTISLILLASLNNHLSKIFSIIHPNLHKIKGGFLLFSAFHKKTPFSSYFSQKEVAFFVEMVYNRPTGYAPRADG